MDLIQRAAAASPAEAASLLRAAVRASDQIWVARNAARLFVEHVGDRDAACDVIAGCQPLTCTEWRLVAAAWVELGELQRAGKCLERAAHNARVAADLCVLAMGYRDAKFEDEARLLVEGAERLATLAIDCWIVANCYRDTFDDAARARTTLVHGMRDAIGVPEILGFARAFAAHDAEHEELTGYVARAERVASTVGDWIELSRAQQILLVDLAEAERCVIEASRLSTSPQDERAIAIARGRLHLPLLDDERPMLSPAKLLRPGARSFAWDRDANRLLGWLRARIPRGSIEQLVRPGQFFASDDTVTLLDLQKSGNIPHPLPAYLDTLVQYSRRRTNFDHEVRAFACVVVIADDAAATVSDAIEPVLAALVESCFALGADAVAGAAAFFAALSDAYEATRSTTADGYLVLFADLALALVAAWLDPRDPRIPQLVERLIADERLHPHERPDWLFGLSATPSDTWRALAKRVAIPQLAPLL